MKLINILKQNFLSGGRHCSGGVIHCPLGDMRG